MTGYEMIKKHRAAALETSIKELERLADTHVGSSHYLSEESFKLGLKFAIRQIEETEILHLKMMKEVTFSNPKEAEREHKNQMNVLMTLKNSLIARYEGRP